VIRQAVLLPTGGECGDPRFVVELGERAEAAGWAGAFLEDYVCYQGAAAEPTCDPWAVLAALAVRTRTIRLGTLVTPLARRRPWIVARQAAAVDQLSEGRMILGVGLGDVGDSVVTDASFVRFGEELEARRRAELLDEALEIVAGLWSGKPFSFSGEHFRLEEVTFLPKPVQEPRIPIWVGGGFPTRRPLERAARWDGSCLYRETHGGPWEDMSPDDVRVLRSFVLERRGTLAGYDVCVGGVGRRPDWEAERELIASLADAGATWWGEWLPPHDRAEMRAAVDRGPLSLA